MSDLKLYEVVCSISFYLEVEASDEESAKSFAEQSLIDRGVYDICVSTSPIIIEDVKSLEWFVMSLENLRKTKMLSGENLPVRLDILKPLIVYTMVNYWNLPVLLFATYLTLWIIVFILGFILNLYRTKVKL